MHPTGAGQKPASTFPSQYYEKNHTHYNHNITRRIPDLRRHLSENGDSGRETLKGGSDTCL